MIFWIIAGALALVTTGTIALSVRRSRDAGEHPAEYDLRVYRDQLKEVEKDLARGVIDGADAERIRAEVSRRILAADAQLQAEKSGERAGKHATAPLVISLGVVLVGASLLAYWQLGTPGYGDQPLELRMAEASERMASRISQAEAEARVPPTPSPEPEAQFAALMERLRAAVAENPDDLQGQELLARNEASLNNLKAAYEAQRNVIRLKGDQASSSDYSILANMMIAATEGYISPEAEASLRRSLEINPGNNLAKYYWGLMFLQNDRPDLTFRLWDQVLLQSPPDAPWVPAIRARITDLAWYAGVEYTLPAPPHSDGLSGPTAEDIEAVRDMTDADRADMIRGMVSNLSERLATEGGTPQEWARLIGAYGVLEETGRAQAIFEEAQEVFGTDPQAMQIIREGARRAGIVN
ncbi:c-type cytochrome biogenesis protein CcmI [Shimia abyssi]|uniref:Cytochrome c-type biogenesis protein CcmH n=1 Tax=Shimia abyssi TaxID=1662395 RepID=A0A2P8FJ09_9RHOB|nr:c-type cytochrome biogenesis protein CcmI [Shimia abyssi]PSL21701.1 cytochrome c-type biogenesis protein CcmH [Shimia abyssi]